MPFAKAVIGLDERRGVGSNYNGDAGAASAGVREFDPTLGSEELSSSAEGVFHASFVSICHQLAALSVAADQVFDELCAEYRLIGVRTERLARRINDLSGVVDRLDAKAVLLPESTISAVSQTKRHFTTDYFYSGWNVFDPISRPLSIQSLYSKGDPTPIGHIRECDTYRTDSIRGAHFFSRIPVVLNKFVDDAVPVGKVNRRIPVPPRRHQIRPLQLDVESESSSGDILDKDESKTGSGDEGNRSETLERASSCTLKTQQPVLVVDIDVSGSGFERIRKFHAKSPRHEVSTDSYSTASLGRYQKKLARPKTIAGISDLVFQEIDVDLLPTRHNQSFKFRNSPKNPLNKAFSQTLEIYAPKERKRSQKRKSGRCVEDDEARSCNSWRQSLKSIFQLSRSRSKDLWSTMNFEENAKARNDNFNLKRSLSLPRSLKSSTKHPFVAFGSFRSSSVEGRLNFRVHQPEKRNDNLGKLPKSVAGERLGRSLTKSLSQVRLGQSSRSQKVFEVPQRPQSMEIRMPFLDEDGQPMLSLYNMASATNVSSVTTVASNGMSDHPWAKSFSTVKLRHENREHKEDCQSSSGRWSGSSGMTEKQLVQESERQMGSTIAIQCSSEASVSTKDSAMCLNFSPHENESISPVEKNRNHFFNPNLKVMLPSTADQKNQVERVHVGTKASSPGYESVTRQSQISISPQSTVSGEDSDSEVNLRIKSSSSKSPFRRSTKSGSTSKPKDSSRSSFLLKLKKFGGKSSKPETAIESRNSEIDVTTEELISLNDFQNSSLLTPSLPRSKSNELKKLAELADRMANAKAKSKYTSHIPVSVSLSSPASSSSSCATGVRDSVLRKSPLGMAEMNRDVSVVLHCQKSCCEFPNQCGSVSPSHSHVCQIVGVSSPTTNDDQVSPVKLDQRSHLRGQKATELESILETSHDCETASPYAVRSKLVTRKLSPRPESKMPGQEASPLNRTGRETVKVGIEAPSAEKLSNATEENDLLMGNSELEHAGILSEKLSITAAQNRPRTLQLLPKSNESKVESLQTLPDPSPANARLIISSPVASRAYFVDNPHKRLLCQALSPEELLKFSSEDTHSSASPSTSSNHFIFPEISTPHKAPLNFSKHLSRFSVAIRERVDPSNYGRSWYDGIYKESNTLATPTSDDILSPSGSQFVKCKDDAIKINRSGSFGRTLPSSLDCSSTFKNQTDCKSSIRPPSNSSTSSSDSRCTVNINCSEVRSDTPLVVESSASSTKKSFNKKCARVVFPSSEAIGVTRTSSVPPNSSISNLKTNRTLAEVSKQKSVPRVNLARTGTFQGDTSVRRYPVLDSWCKSPDGDEIKSNSLVACDMQIVKSNTLPRSCRVAWNR